MRSAQHVASDKLNALANVNIQPTQLVLKPKTRWLRAILLGLALLAIPIPIHALLSIRASYRLNRTIESLVDPELRLDVAQISSSQPDGPDNGANDLRRAARLIMAEPEVPDEYDQTEFKLPLSAHHRELIAAKLAQSEPAFALVRAGCAKPRCEWLFNAQPPLANALRLKEWEGLRAIDGRLCTAALLDHANGDDRRAIVRLDLSLDLARALDRHPSEMSHTLARNTVFTAACFAQMLAADLRIDEGPQAMTAEGLRAFIQRLLDDHEYDSRLVTAIQNERTIAVDTLRALRDGVPVDWVGGGAPELYEWYMRLAARPMFDDNARQKLQATNGAIAAARETNFHVATSKWPRDDALFKKYPLYFLFVGSDVRMLRHTLTWEHRARVDRRLAATLLAIRWYQVEHDGTLPQTLDDLAPRYLASVPRDPFSPADAPLIYRSAGPDPIVYSVGDNAIDDGGSDVPIDPLSRDPSEWARFDRVAHLKREREPGLPVFSNDDAPRAFPGIPSAPAPAPDSNR